MHALTGEELLIAWERSRQRPKHEAVLCLLALASPERSFSELASMPLGSAMCGCWSCVPTP